jgi:hypothetical protein
MRNLLIKIIKKSYKLWHQSAMKSELALPSSIYKLVNFLIAIMK